MSTSSWGHRMIRIARLLSVILFLAPPMNVMAATANDVQGIWALDIEASERAILADPPYKLAREFGMTTALWCCILLRFDGNFATTVLYGGRGNPAKYEFTTANNSELSYAFKNVESRPADVARKQSVLLVSILDGGQLNVRFPNDQGSIGYLPLLRWKRVNLDLSRTTPRDAEPALDAWFAALQRIQSVLDKPPPTGSASSAER